MPSFGRSLVFPFLLGALAAVPAGAQPTDLLPGDVGIFADAEATISRVDGLDPLVPVDAYVVVGAPGPINAYEFALDLFSDRASDIFVTRADFEGA